MFVKKYEKIIFLFLVIISFFLVFINTAMSPLYDTAYITHDASVFYVIGRGMKEGLLPYKDLFDHKGIYIYILYFLAAFIGEKKSIGLFIIFAILVSIFSIFVYKIIKIYSDDKNKFISFFATLFLVVLSISLCFSHGALLCEYLALDTIVISMYLMIKNIFLETVSGYKPIYMFVNGILAAINLFNKANYTLYFLAVAIYVFVDLVFFKKNIILLIKNILAGILGLIIGVLPCVVYGLYTGCLKDMLYCTFTFNFDYVDDISIDLPKEVHTKFEAFIYTCTRYINLYFMLFFNIFYIIASTIYKKKNLTAHELSKKIRFIFFYILAVIFLSISIFAALTGYTHYQSLLIPFLFPLIVWFAEGIYKCFIGDNSKKISKVLCICILFIATMCVSYVIGGYQLKINFDMNSSKAYSVKKKISPIVKLDGRSKILCYGFGTYYYNYLGVMPKSKYFYIPGISYEKFSEPYDSLRDDIMNFKYDIVLYSTNEAAVSQIGSTTDEFLENNYVKIMEISKYRKIYARKELMSDE